MSIPAKLSHGCFSFYSGTSHFNAIKIAFCIWLCLDLNQKDQGNICTDDHLYLPESHEAIKC
jgi:hypothetical protein